MGRRRRRSDERIEGGPAGGIALVVVVWTLLPLSLIAAGFLARKGRARARCRLVSRHSITPQA